MKNDEPSFLRLEREVELKVVCPPLLSDYKRLQFENQKLRYRVAELEAGDSIEHDNDGDKQLVDVGKLIFSGDWELIEQNGLIYLTKHGYGIKIVLSLQNAREVWRMLNAWVEGNAEAEVE